jgi:hypothetical protein
MKSWAKVVYCIGLFNPGKSEKERKALDLLAQETGGKTFYPENEIQLNEMVRQVAQEIGKQIGN